jgi:cytochrome oxidase Cu insertion factor (SCO1/SenC/PrrC family)
VIDAGAAARGRAARATLAIVLAGAAVLGVGAGIVLHLLNAGAASVSTAGLRGQATWAAGARPAPPITALRDQTGRLFTLSSLRGRTAVITFFDSHCNEACPLEGRALAAAERSLPRAERPVLVVVTVNPRDTPSSTRAAARKWGLAQVGAWHWLWGGRGLLARVWGAYHIFVAPRKGDIVHTEALYLIDRHGDERSAYLYPFAPRFMAQDLATLART